MMIKVVPYYYIMDGETYVGPTYAQKALKIPFGDIPYKLFSFYGYTDKKACQQLTDHVNMMLKKYGKPDRVTCELRWRITYNNMLAGPMLNHGIGKTKSTFPEALNQAHQGHNIFKDKDKAIAVAKRLKEYMADRDKKKELKLMKEKQDAK